PFSTYWRTGSSGDASGSCRIVTITSLSRSSITGSLNPNSRILSKAVFRRCLATVRSGNCVIEVTSEAESLGNVGLATTGDSHAVGEGRSGVIGNVDGESDGRITRT